MKTKFQSTPELIYGIEHFLRLFVALPKLISAEWFTEEDHQNLRNGCANILKIFSDRINEYKNWKGKKLEDIEK